MSEILILKICLIIVTFCLISLSHQILKLKENFSEILDGFMKSTEILMVLSEKVKIDPDERQELYEQAMRRIFDVQLDEEVKKS